MTAVALDTLRISKRLREAGFSEPQAEAVTGVLHDAQEVALGDLVTKADFRELKSEMRDLRAEVKADAAAVKADVAVLKWAVGLIVAGVIALVMKAFLV